MTITGPATRATTTTQPRIPRQVSGRELLEHAPPPPVLPLEPVVHNREPLPRGLVRVLAVAGVVLLVLVGFALRTLTSEPGGSAPAELRAQVAAMLEARAKLMAAERAYAPAMATANRKIDRYTRAKRAVDVETSGIVAQNQDQYLRCQSSQSVSCPTPTYPEEPKAFDPGAQVAKLRAVAADLKSLHAEVQAQRPVILLAPAHAQLVEVTRKLEVIATTNAKVLSASVLPPEGRGPGYVNTTGLRKLARNTTLTDVAQLDQTVLSMLASAGLPLSWYPAGTGSR